MISQENIMKIWNDENKNKYYPIKINIVDISNGSQLVGKARSKGDRHLHKEDILLQSYRVNLKGDNRFLGLEEFSIQRPIIRGFTWELLIAEIFQSQNLLTLKTYPVNFSVNGDNRGIYL